MFLAVAGDDLTVPAKLLDALQNRFPDLDVVAILDRLKSLHLAQSHSPRYSLCGSLPSVLAGAWDLTAARDQMLAVALDWLPAQEPSAPVEDSLPLMQRLLSDAAARLKWPEVVRLGRALEPLVFRYTRWQAWADVLNVLLRAAQATADAALEGWVLHQLGSRALAEGTLDAASTYLSQALKIRESVHDGPGLEVTRHNLDVLKAATAPARGNGSGKSGSGGARSLTFGIFGFAGLVVLALAGYALFRPRPAPPAPPALCGSPRCIYQLPPLFPRPTFRPRPLLRLRHPPPFRRILRLPLQRISPYRGPIRSHCHRRRFPCMPLRAGLGLYVLWPRRPEERCSGSSPWARGYRLGSMGPRPVRSYL